MLNSILNLEGVAVLTKEQQINLTGGNYAISDIGLSASAGTGTCAFYIPKCTAPGEHGPQCNYGQGSIVVRNVDKKTAQGGAAAYGGKWCCDSCGGASWY